MVSDTERLRRALAGRYEIERELGRGGMAIVYLARDLKHDREVAIKVLHSDLAGAVAGERFVQEIQIAARLSHPHIVPLHDSGEADGQLYYVMPRVRGETLRQRVARESQLPVSDVVQIVRDVAQALTFAHSHGVIHRDIKPENILLSEGSAVVADFGIARAIRDAGGDRLTSLGITVGTPAYMSPEQSSGDAELGAPCDQYSLACVTFEILSGQPPFVGPTQQQVLVRHVVAPVPSIHALRESIPSAVDAVFEKAMAKAPGERYESPSAFAEALSNALFTPISVPQAPLGRHRLALTWRTAALGALLLAGGGALAVAVTRTKAPPPVPMVVVLPFDNMGDVRDEYFADGITDEIITRLSGFSGMGVIARASAAYYKGRHVPARQVARELGVQFVLTGTVRSDRRPDGSGIVKVSPSLVRAGEDRELLANTAISAALVPGEIIRLQSQIAEQVAASMNVTLPSGERKGLDEGLTEDRGAYEAYLRGNTFVTEYLSEEPNRRAVEEYERAVALDPKFAQAWAKLGQSQSMYYFFFDHTPQRLTRAQEAVRQAVSLVPGGAQTRLAVGYLAYWGSLDYTRAMQEFDRVRQLQPSNAELLWASAQVMRRQGRWEEAVRGFQRAAELDPRSHTYLYDLASTQVALGSYDSGGLNFDRVIALKPEWTTPYASKALFKLATGDTVGARAVLQLGRQRVGTRALLAMLVHSLFRARLSSLGQAFSDSLEALTLSSGVLDSSAYYLSKAEWYRSQRRAPRDVAYYDSARKVLEVRVRARPDDPAIHAELGMALAGLGRHDEAIQEARLAVAIAPLSKDALGGVGWAVNLAHVYTLVGESDAAIRLLDTLRRLPSAVTQAVLRNDPRWAPLRAKAAFSSLLQPVR